MTAPTYIVVVDSLDASAYLDRLPGDIERAALRAVNKTTRDGRVMASRKIRDQIDFTASYLGPSAGRLTVVKQAKKGDLEGIIRARTSPTSLARFTKEEPLQKGQSTRRRRKGVKVTVKKGVARFISGAFVIPLRAGKDGPLSNKGLAIRSDTKPTGAYKPKQLGKNLWLLYGPSVAQILYSVRNRGGVAEEIAPELGERLQNEFIRLLELDID